MDLVVSGGLGLVRVTSERWNRPQLRRNNGKNIVFVSMPQLNAIVSLIFYAKLNLFVPPSAHDIDLL